ncbi:MAG: hypothetical protein PHD32_01450 [Eubacteriales bacterium]|nr:hypothetical protein [Eubacteriales bacterium]
MILHFFLKAGVAGVIRIKIAARRGVSIYYMKNHIKVNSPTPGMTGGTRILHLCLPPFASAAVMPYNTSHIGKASLREEP